MGSRGKQSAAALAVVPPEIEAPPASTPAAPPSHLSGEAAAWWRSVVSDYDLEPHHLRLLEDWLRSYGPEELFDETGAPVELVRRANPDGELRMSAIPHANGGLLTRSLDMPDFRKSRQSVTPPQLHVAPSPSPHE